MNPFDFFMVANQWTTNCRLKNTNNLLEQIRRQGLTPAERKAEDASREKSAAAEERLVVVLASLALALIAAFFIYSAWYNAHLPPDHFPVPAATPFDALEHDKQVEKDANWQRILDMRQAQPDYAPRATLVNPHPTH